MKCPLHTVTLISQNQSYHMILTVIINIKRTTHQDSTLGVQVYIYAFILYI